MTSIEFAKSYQLDYVNSINSSFTFKKKIVGDPHDTMDIQYVRMPIKYIPVLHNINFLLTGSGQTII